MFVEVTRACGDDMKSLLMKRKDLSWIFSNLFVLKVLQNATLAGNNQIGNTKRFINSHLALFS